MPAVPSVVTIHPAREDGGSYHGAPRAHRGFSNFSVPAVRSVVSFGLIRLYHQLSLLGYNTDLCQLVPNTRPKVSYGTIYHYSP